MIERVGLSRYMRSSSPVLMLKPSQESARQALMRDVSSGFYEMEEVPCLCGSSRSSVLATRDRYNLPIRTLLCRDCGLVRTSPRPSGESLSLFYGGPFRELYTGGAAMSSDYFDRQVHRGRAALDWVASHGIETGTVFEVGCSAGGVLSVFADAGWTVVGVDVDADFVAEGRARGLNLIQGESKELRRFGTADLIIMSHVLEHLPDPIVQVQEVHGLLRNGGYLYLEVPGLLNMRGDWRRYDPLRSFHIAHLYNFTLDTLRLVVQQVDFEFLDGDQFVRALFRKVAPAAAPLHAHTSDARRIRRYLLLAERERFYWRLRLRARKLLRRWKSLPRLRRTVAFMLGGPKSPVSMWLARLVDGRHDTHDTHGQS